MMGRSLPAVTRTVTQVIFDPEELIVLCDPIGSARSTGLDLTRIKGDSEIRNGGVLRLSRPVADNALVIVAACEGYRLKSLGERSDLIDLHQNCVCDALVNALLKALGIGDKEVVADKLRAMAQGLG
jgi:hypothetical protein